MKKLLFSTLVILAIALTGCTSSVAGNRTGSSNNVLPTETQLAVGTLKLTGTDQDVTADQAKELVVYWEVYQKLSQSETAAQAEIDGLTAQIQETMTDGQMNAITAMNITQQDVLTSMQGVTDVSSNTGDSTISLPSGSASGGGMPAGGPPADGGGAPLDGGGMPSDMSGAAQAPGTDQSQSSQANSGSTVIAEVPSALVEAVIQALQQKIAA
jgi:hypothetical protein